jgi:Arm DNA-binding domain
MIERIRLLKIPRRKWNRMKFTEKNVLALKAHRTKQYQAWDYGNEAARGLSVLVSPSGVKSFRATFYFNGSSKPHFKSLGRVGEMSLAEARELTRKARGDARKGIDPRADDVRKSDAFEAALRTTSSMSRSAAMATSQRTRPKPLCLPAPRIGSEGQWRRSDTRKSKSCCK